jgi:hypothetical protein
VVPDNNINKIHSCWYKFAACSSGSPFQQGEKLEILFIAHYDMMIIMEGNEQLYRTVTYRTIWQ